MQIFNSEVQLFFLNFLASFCFLLIFQLCSFPTLITLSRKERANGFVLQLLLLLLPDCVCLVLEIDGHDKSRRDFVTTEKMKWKKKKRSMKHKEGKFRSRRRCSANTYICVWVFFFSFPFSSLWKISQVDTDEYLWWFSFSPRHHKHQHTGTRWLIIFKVEVWSNRFSFLWCAHLKIERFSLEAHKHTRTPANKGTHHIDMGAIS